MQLFMIEKSFLVTREIRNMHSVHLPKGVLTPTSDLKSKLSFGAHNS